MKTHNVQTNVKTFDIKTLRQKIKEWENLIRLKKF